MEARRRQVTFRALGALAFFYGCGLFVAGVSWLRSALEWTHHGRAVEWQQYSMSALLLSFALLVLLGLRRPRLTWRLFVGVACVTLLQGMGITQSTGEGVGEAAVGCILLVGLPALLAAWLFAWRSRWKDVQPGRTILSS